MTRDMELLLPRFVRSLTAGDFDLYVAGVLGCCREIKSLYMTNTTNYDLLKNDLFCFQDLLDVFPYTYIPYP